VPANEFGPKGIRVNSIHPNAVRTDMVLNEATYGLFRPDLQHPALDDAAAAVA
jgi:NAD(P)-dependent dehydrogenase (short-subunit alcohol dehydrogenase family)